MARFFVVTINYAPEPSGFAPHATQIADYLASHGHDVAVFTGFPFAPAWRRRDADRGRWLAVERRSGVDVHRLTHFIPHRPSSVVQRIAMEGSFGIVAFVAMLAASVRRGRPDAILYIGAQPAAAMAARLLAAFIARPYFVRITDLAADAARNVGMADGWLWRILRMFEFAAYRRATGANVLCASFEDALAARGYPRDRIRWIHNPIDTTAIRSVAPTGLFRRQYGIPADAFVVMHAGSMGRKQALMNVIEAAALRREPPVYWVLVGDGELREQLVEAVRIKDVGAIVRFVPFQPQAVLSEMFADADALLISQLRTIKDTLIPGKLLTYMAAGRPVLAAVNPDSEAAQLLREAEGGLLVPPEDPVMLAAGARTLADMDRSVLSALGCRNRRYAETHFDERVVLAAHEQFMLDRMIAVTT